MNMKSKWIPPAISALTLIATALAVTGCRNSDSGGQAHHYTCPMKEHSDVVSDKPDDCPKCGMKLVEKK